MKGLKPKEQDFFYKSGKKRNQVPRVCLTFRSIAGPGTGQRGLKGNTITFPQDVVGVSKKLPPKMELLSDVMKVIFY